MLNKSKLEFMEKDEIEDLGCIWIFQCLESKQKILINFCRGGVDAGSEGGSVENGMGEFWKMT